MSKLSDARKILKSMGMPISQQGDVCCYTLLALADLSEDKKWIEAQSKWIRIHDIISSTSEKYNVLYAENSRETFRKQALHHFRNAALIEDNGLATNSPNYSYRLTKETLELIKAYDSNVWEAKLFEYLSTHKKLIDIYKSTKKMTMLPVKINDQLFNFSPGKHNELQKAILEEFAPRFAPNSICLYVGDTTKKDMSKNNTKLLELGFDVTLHDKMPDVILFREDKNWLYFIEAVTSVGPMDPKRVNEISEMTQKVSFGKVFVTAFLDYKTFRKFAEKIAWETEVWLAEFPEHMIHLNGDKFLGPRV